ncbi:MAG: hypothetical protein Q7U96_02920 [Chloroflexota bacterium]|nr:hypothetical protein [Chloroflexota bacterium]
MSDEEEQEQEEDLHPCQQCAMLRESLQPCEGDCGREICSYCGPKCHECVDRETIKEIKQEEEEKKRRKKEAEEQPWDPERSVLEKVSKAIDWVFGFADGAIRSELQEYPGEFKEMEEHLEFEEIQKIIKDRYRRLPDWKKSLYKAKKTGENIALKTALKAGKMFASTIESMRKHGR